MANSVTVPFNKSIRGGQWGRNKETNPDLRDRREKIIMKCSTGLMPLILAMPVVLGLAVDTASAQQISPEELIYLTPLWEGERFDDGRPRVPDDVLERMQHVTLEEAWAVLRNNRFNFQFEGDWQVLDPDAVLVGRAVTATFVPGRPDIQEQFDKRGREQGRSGSQNSWPVDMLVPGDVYVGD